MPFSRIPASPPLKRTFHIRIPRSPFDDPFLYLRFFHTGRAVIFDLGDLSFFTPRDLMRITDAFVTHTHMDHFIGLDRLIRVHLQRSASLRVYGPAGFLGNVEGKLKSYTWNLSGGYPLSIFASEVDGTLLKKAVFRARTGFQREDAGVRPWEGVLLEEPAFRIRVQILDHGVPCLGFRVEEKAGVRIRSGELQRRGLVPGPWIAELKAAIAGTDPPSTKLKVKTCGGFRETVLEDLEGIWSPADGAVLAYVVDTAPTPDNLQKVIDLARGADVLYIEASFLSEDSTHAVEKKHLTAVDAGRIASIAKVKKTRLIHLSPRYEGKEDLVLREAAHAAGRECRVERGWKD